MIRIDEKAIENEAIAEIVRRLRDALDPDRILLFGSRARGDARSDSDYDLLVIKDTADQTTGMEKAAYRAMKGLAVGLDILVETPERVSRLAAREGTLICDAVREGKSVYERAERPGA